MKKNSILKFFIILLIPVVLAASAIVIIDPFFHYHAPIKGMPYVLTEERYQNNGIARHFKYEAIITGSSTSQNFKTTDVERLWGYEAVKLPFAGATFKEQDSIVRTAIAANDDLKLVIRGLDPNRINCDKDEMGYENYPQYLYDKNPFNDYDYLFNKDVWVMIGNIVMRGIKGKGPMTFDEYSNRNDMKTFGREAVLRTFERQDVVAEPVHFTDEDFERIRDNINQNIIDTAKAHPDIEFYLFMTPPCVCFWDALIRSGNYEDVMDELELTYEMLLEVDNIKLYSFFDRIDITGNLDNYMDTLHYSEDINTYICECMKRGEGLMTEDNYLEHLENVRKLYLEFDHDSIFE